MGELGALARTRAAVRGGERGVGAAPRPQPSAPGAGIAPARLAGDRLLPFSCKECFPRRDVS